MLNNIQINFGGFYESIHSDYIDNAIESYRQDEDGVLSEAMQEEIFDMDYTEVKNIYCNEYVDMINENVGTNIKFKALLSPRFYNYSTDIIEVDIIKPGDFFKIMRYIIDMNLKKEVYQLATDSTTSVDGYAAFYTYDELMDNNDLMCGVYLDVIAEYLNNNELDQYLDLNNVYEAIGLC